jgi:UDP-N-acetylmuramate dehydrogenase
MRRLEEKIRGRVSFNEPMARHTSFRIGGPADIMVEPVDVDDLSIALADLRRRDIPTLILGMGTNVLVRDGGIRGCVILMHGMKRIEKKESDEVYAEAGGPLMGLIRQCARWALSGLENLSGIPGSVGGAVRMNAGAHGSEMGDVVRSVTLMGPDGEVREKQAGELGFAYRTCGLGRDEIILGARLSLTRRDPGEISRVISERLSWRKERQPLALPSAGSIFKNPPEGPAGGFIDEAGLKGLSVGAAQVSALHANFIVNRGGARAGDVLSLVVQIQREVRRKRGIDLDLEIKVIGEDL